MGERLRVEIDVPAALMEARVPPMTVLTLAENAVKHGLGPKGEGGTLRIEASLQGEVLEVAVCDDGVGLRLGAGHGSRPVEYAVAARGGLRLARSARDRVTGPTGGVRAALLLPFAPCGRGSRSEQRRRLGGRRGSAEREPARAGICKRCARAWNSLSRRHWLIAAGIGVLVGFETPRSSFLFAQ